MKSAPVESDVIYHDLFCAGRRSFFIQDGLKND